VDPRLRRAVDASRAWYDDLFALHGVPTACDGGLWRALAAPPPYHSRAKTLVPGVPAAAVLEAVGGSGAVADSFADLDLPGLAVLFEATWLHHPGGRSDGVPSRWSVVRTPEALARWSRLHDYDGVLTDAVLDRPVFTVLGWVDGDELVGGAVLHDSSEAVEVSNTWSLPGRRLAYDELLAAAHARHPGRELTGYARGDDLAGLLAAGFEAVGTQRVWLG